MVASKRRKGKRLRGDAAHERADVATVRERSPSSEVLRLPSLQRLTCSVLDSSLTFTSGLELVCGQLVSFLEAALSDDMVLRRRAPKSVLVSGPAGTGKSSVVTTALARYRRRQPYARPVVLYLAGDVLADDDLCVYRSLAAQLHRESEPTDTEAVSQMPAPDLCSETNDLDGVEQISNSLPHTASSCIEQIVHDLHTLLRTAANGMVTASDSKADTPRISGVVLILDDFDRFARQTQNIRQQLLYSLFNMIASDDTAPFVIIGVTRRFDAVDLLEKRVRSRFSQVVFRVPPPMSATELQEHLVNRLEAALGDEAQSDTTCLNESLRLLRRILSDDAEVAQRISELFRQCRQMRPYLSALTHMLAVLSYEEDRDPARAVPKLLQIFSLYVLRRDIRQRLCSLSSMELTLLVAHSRIARRQESQSASFAQVYDEYARFIQASAGAAQRNESGNEFVTTGSGLNALDNALLGDRGPLLSKAVALRILERLIEAELLTVAASARNSSSAKMHIPLVQLFPNETLVDVVRKHPCASTSLQRWCKSWLE